MSDHTRYIFVSGGVAYAGPSSGFQSGFATADVSNPDSLTTVRATNEDMALAGEGLADALNVGAY